MSRHIHIHYYRSPLGELIIGDYEGQLCMLDWRYRAKRNRVDERLLNFFKATFTEQETNLHHAVIKQIEEYLRRERQQFDLPLLFAGSDFQQKVWNELLQIPFGKTISYIDLSRKLGDEKAIRAVASANGANAISIIIPCHRVVGSKGELTGYAGGISAKQKLLEVEGAILQPELF